MSDCSTNALMANLDKRNGEICGKVTKTGVSSTESDIVLRECHFCGGEAKILNDGDWWTAWHECPDCGYEGRCTRCLCATA